MRAQVRGETLDWCRATEAARIASLRERPDAEAVRSASPSPLDLDEMKGPVGTRWVCGARPDVGDGHKDSFKEGNAAARAQSGARAGSATGPQFQNIRWNGYA